MTDPQTTYHAQRRIEEITARNQAANEVYGYSHGLTNVLADWRRTSDKDYMRGYRRGRLDSAT